jgi:hypothetical protein
VPKPLGRVGQTRAKEVALVTNDPLTHNAMRRKPPVVLKVGKGRGFVIATAQEHLVITAAHCLPELPPSASISYTHERTYPKLLAAIDKRRSVWAECLFVDPVADIAVLASPDNQEKADKATAYERLTSGVTPLPVSELDGEQAVARLLPLQGPSFRCVVRAVGRGSLWMEKHTKPVVGGMSGSPILAQDGSAIGVVVTPNGPNPSLASHLPGWLLAKLGLK